MTEFISLGSAVTAAAFAVMLARQYLSRKKFYQLIWTVSMSLFALGAFLEFVMSGVNVNAPLFDFYYVIIGPQVGLLGAGVVYLLRPRLGKYVLYFVALLSASLIVSVLLSPTNITGLVAGTPTPLETYQQWFQSSVVYGIYYAVAAVNTAPRDLTQVLDYLGAVLVIGGGLLSFAIDRRRKYALLLALGALMNAIGGILLGVLGDPDVFLYFEFFGIVLFFLGFLMSSRFDPRSGMEHTAAVPTPSGAPKT